MIGHGERRARRGPQLGRREHGQLFWVGPYEISPLRNYSFPSLQFWACSHDFA
jgi:hypothetical protein